MSQQMPPRLWCVRKADYDDFAMPDEWAGSSREHQVTANEFRFVSLQEHTSALAEKDAEISECLKERHANVLVYSEEITRLREALERAEKQLAQTGMMLGQMIEQNKLREMPWSHSVCEHYDAIGKLLAAIRADKQGEGKT
jgi:hypothetical protein